MLTNIELRRLNDLVADGVARGLDHKAALAPLEQELEDAAVRTGDMPFGAYDAPEPLPGRLLLCSGLDGVKPHLADAYLAIAGGGIDYNGMFGDGSMLRDALAAAEVLNQDRVPASVAEQTVCCVMLLGAPQGSQDPELTAVVRRHLSQILLRFPVLMHPAIVIPAWRNANPEYTTIPAALCRTLGGSLPRYSHFHRPANGQPAARDDKALMGALTAFARHPCTTAAMTQDCVRVYMENLASARKPTIRYKFEKLGAASASHIGPNAQLLASVMELDDLASPGPRALRLETPFWETLKLKPPLSLQLASRLAWSVLSAGGLVHDASFNSSLPRSMLRHEEDPEFLAAVKARAGTLFHPDWNFGDLAQGVVPKIQRAIFSQPRDPLAENEITHNARQVVRTLVDCGMCMNMAEAVHVVLMATIGARRPNDHLPKVEVSGALAFLRALDETGGLGLDDDKVIASVAAIRGGVLLPKHPIPYRDEWVTACDVFSTERVMFAAIDRATAQASFDFPQQPVSPTRHRARVGV